MKHYHELPVTTINNSNHYQCLVQAVSKKRRATLRDNVLRGRKADCFFTGKLILIQVFLHLYGINPIRLRSSWLLFCTIRKLRNLATAWVAGLEKCRSINVCKFPRETSVGQWNSSRIYQQNWNNTLLYVTIYALVKFEVRCEEAHSFVPLWADQD